MHLKRGGYGTKCRMYKQHSQDISLPEAVALVGDDTQVEVVAKEDACLTSRQMSFGNVGSTARV